jgi:hypothetical protein
MVYTGAPFTMKKLFWTTKKSDTAQDLQATVQDTLEHKDKSKPFEVHVLVEVPGKKHQKYTYFHTEILVSIDLLAPTDGTRELHKNCLREAIMDTYPQAREDPNFTLQMLLDVH